MPTSPTTTRPSRLGLSWSRPGIRRAFPLGREPQAHRTPGAPCFGLGRPVPVPILDDVLAGRVRAGLYMKLAASRQVDLPATSAEVLAERRAGSVLRNVTLTAATLVALKLAWRKFLPLLAAGRGAEDMATIFQVATLVDHYCARLHVGGPISRPQASELRALTNQIVSRNSKTKLVAAFREGGKILGNSVAEAPRWVSHSLSRHAELRLRTGGHPESRPRVGRPTRATRRGAGSSRCPCGRAKAGHPGQRVHRRASRRFGRLLARAPGGEGLASFAA